MPRDWSHKPLPTLTRRGYDYKGYWISQHCQRWYLAKDGRHVTLRGQPTSADVEQYVDNLQKGAGMP